MKTRRKILIVDDNMANLTTCKAILKDAYDVFTVLSVASMMSLLENIRPDLIMLDVKMPDISGYEAAKMLKNDDAYKDIPIIFVSALSDVESEMEGLELGAVDYITKPYFPPILIRRIETHLELLDKTKQLESASQAKTNFLTNMSHEMRSPLTVVLGMTELTLKTAQLDNETYSNLIKVYRAGDTLLKLINDILDISKIEAESFTLNPAEYDFPAMLSDTITQSILYSESKPIEFILDIDENLPCRLCGDEMRVKQILINLLSNAFKYTAAGTVELGVKCEADRNGEGIWLAAWVRDTGTGIRQEDIGKLFNTFTRMEEEATGRNKNRRTEGTGLGLYISKKAAEMMNGLITVESEYGKGSRFDVRLRQERAGNAVIGAAGVESLKNRHFYAEKFKNADKTHINMSYANVLVVDDNITNLDVIKNLLGLYGMKVDCVTDGRQAIDMIRDETVKYNAVFMDHLMPDIDGVEAVRIIREEIGTLYAQTVPIIALTANAVRGNEEMFLSKGFQAFIPKPIDMSLLDSILRRWVRDEKAEALLPSKTISIANQAPAHIAIPHGIPGLDTGRGISCYGLDENAYIGILRSYAINTKPLLDMAENVSRDSLGEYAIIIHGIKGSSRGIFADAAGNEAEALELAARAGDFDFVRENNPKFVESIRRLIACIEDAINKTGITKKPVKDSPDEALLQQLLDACVKYDIDAMDAAMAELEKWEYISGGGLVSQLRSDLGQGKYKEIKEKLTK